MSALKKEPTSIDIANSHPVSLPVSNLSVNGGELSKDQSLRQLVSADQVTEIEFDAVTFIDGPNSNGFRFFSKDLDSFATSFSNKPYLRNHDQSDIDSRDGTIISGDNNSGEFEMRIRITTDRGIKDFAQGKMDRFSIGWDYDGILCGVCSKDYLAFSDCPHILGHKYDGELCEIFFENPRGIETSAVNVPAVQGTHILSKLNSKINHFAKLEEINNMDDIQDDLIDLDASQDDIQDDAPVLQQSDDDQVSGNRLQVAAQAITPHVLAALLQDPELQATFAKAFFLDDMDTRIGSLESLLEEARLENERLASQLDALNGEILPGGDFYSYAHDEVANAPRWNGYQGSALSGVRPQSNPHPEPPKSVRPVRQGRLKRQQKTNSRVSKRQEAGEQVLDMWGGE